MVQLEHMDELAVSKLEDHLPLRGRRGSAERVFPVRITRFGKPVADIVPIAAPQDKPWIGALRDSVESMGDLVEPVGAFAGLGSSAPLRLLLDTHIWIWLLSRPEKLTRTVRRNIENPKNELYLSPVSIWEAHHLARTGRLRLKQPFPAWLTVALQSAPIREAPFNFAVAAAASGISLPQGDPGDVSLAATASALDLTLVTADAHLIECSWLKTLAN